MLIRLPHAGNGPVIQPEDTDNFLSAAILLEHCIEYLPIVMLMNNLLAPSKMDYNLTIFVLINVVSILNTLNQLLKKSIHRDFVH